MPNYSQFLDPARKELTGHLRRLMWGAILLEAQSCAQCSEALDLEALEQTKPWVLQIERD